MTQCASSSAFGGRRQPPKESIHSSFAKRQVRDSRGKFASKDDPTKLPPISVTTNNLTSVNTTNPPDLLNVKVINPLVYIKYWWKRIMANEGIDMRFRMRPLTVFGIALIAFSLAFGLGGVVLPTIFPWMKFEGNQIIPSPTSQQEIWKDTALKGTLRKTNTIPARFFLVTTSTEAVYLETPDEINLSTLVGKRILAIGTYNSRNKILQVEDIQDLEVLPTTPVPIPTSTPIPILTPSPIPIPTASHIPERLVSPSPSITPSS